MFKTNRSIVNSPRQRSHRTLILAPVPAVCIELTAWPVWFGPTQQSGLTRTNQSAGALHYCIMAMHLLTGSVTDLIRMVEKRGNYVYCLSLLYIHLKYVLCPPVSRYVNENRSIQLITIPVRTNVLSTLIFRDDWSCNKSEVLLTVFGIFLFIQCPSPGRATQIFLCLVDQKRLGGDPQYDHCLGIRTVAVL